MAVPALRRSLLYVPSSSPRMLAKSLTLASDNITYDLEDAVTETAKPAARAALRAHLESLARGELAPPANGTGGAGSKTEIAVRINAVSTPHALADLTALGPVALSAVDAVVVPKTNAPSDLVFVSDAVGHIQRQAPSDSKDSRDRPTKLIALIESARAVMDLKEICTAGTAPDRAATTPLDGLIFAAEDFALDMSITRTPSLSEFLYARSAIVTAARAFGLASAIDLVCTQFRGDQGLTTLANECIDGRGMGFTGKQCIHPTQVSIVQQVYGRMYDAADRNELAWAVRVLIAEDKSATSGRGAFTLDGAMIDAPVVGKAKRLLEQAMRAGAADFIQSLRDKYKDQEPE